MEASRTAWLAEQHGAQAIGESLEAIARVSLPHGAILVLALPEEVEEGAIRTALESDYEIVELRHAPETRDIFVTARRVVKKAAKKAS